MDAVFYHKFNDKPFSLCYTNFRNQEQLLYRKEPHHEKLHFCLWIWVWSRLLQWRIRLCEACSYQDKQKVRFGLMRWIHPNTILSELRKSLVLCETSGFLRPRRTCNYRKRRCLSWTFRRLIWHWPVPILWISRRLIPDGVCVENTLTRRSLLVGVFLNISTAK